MRTESVGALAWHLYDSGWRSTLVIFANAWRSGLRAGRAASRINVGAPVGLQSVQIQLHAAGVAQRPHALTRAHGAADASSSSFASSSSISLSSIFLSRGTAGPAPAPSQS